MVLNHCTVCVVYGPDGVSQKRIPVKCTGEQITLFPGTEHELSDSAKTRVDFFDSQIGHIKTYCEFAVRRNLDPSARAGWVADCCIREVIEITEGRRSIRTGMGKEAVITLLGRGDFGAVIQNVSEDGIYFISEERAECGDIIRFSHSFMEKEHQVEAEILREEDMYDGRYGYGCRFLELSKGAERDIRQYVYLRRQGRVW